MSRYDGPIEVGMTFKCIGSPLVSIAPGDTRTVAGAPPEYSDVLFSNGRNLSEEDFRASMRPVAMNDKKFNAAEYPGKGHPWGDFLHHRGRVLAMWRELGHSLEYSAEQMKMDPVQVRLILMTYDEGKVF